jgi:hypothetical protein
MGILGIYASSVLKVTNSYESIATVTVGSGGTSTVTFSSIPSTFKHLQIRFMSMTTRATYGYDALQITFNSDSAANYSYHTLNGNGAAAASGASFPRSNAYFDYVLGTTVSNYPGLGVIDILDYENTSKYKTVRGMGGCDVNGTIASLPGRINFASNSWRSTSAISSMQLTPLNAPFAQYSSFALYGIKG